MARHARLVDQENEENLLKVLEGKYGQSENAAAVFPDQTSVRTSQYFAQHC